MTDSFNGDATRKDYEQKIIESLNTTNAIFHDADKILKLCDPDEYVEGKTFIQLKRLLQGYVENEMDLNQLGTCSQTCNDYTLSQPRVTCVKGPICNHQKRCSGNVIGCRTMSDDMWICPEKPDNHRRYGYITYDNGDILGKPYECEGFHVR